MTEWRTIPSWPEYEASSAGEIRRRGSARPLSPCVLKRGGYLAVSLWRKNKGHTRAVHRLVCEAFHGPAPADGMDAAHRDGDKLRNLPGNLRWATRAENEQDKLAHGVANIGSRNGMSKLTAEDVLAIRAAVARLPRSSGGARIKKGAILPLAERYGVTANCIKAIATKRSWGHLE